MYDDLWSSIDFENVNADLPSVTPPPLESFEEMLKALDGEILHVDLEFPTVTLPLPDIPSSTCPVASTQSQSTYSMPGLTNTGNTEYSSMSTSTSNYPPLFNPACRDIVLGLECNNVDPGPEHSPAISASTTPLMFPPFQHDHVFNMQPDTGPDRQLVVIAPHCRPAAIERNPPPAIPIDPPSTVLNSRVFTGPIRTKHTKKPKKEPTCNRCDLCGRGKYKFCVFHFRGTQCFFLVFDRKSNLTSHIKRHDPNRERPFVCTERNCRYATDRSHDLKRHLTNPNIHGVRAE